MVEILRSRIGERCIYFENVTILPGLVKDYWEDKEEVIVALEVFSAVGWENLKHLSPCPVAGMICWSPKITFMPIIRAGIFFPSTTDGHSFEYGD